MKLLLAVVGSVLHLASLLLSSASAQNPTPPAVAPVQVLLGDPDRSFGVRHIDTVRDGISHPVTIDGVTCRLMDRHGKTDGYFYFSIDPAFKQHVPSNVWVEVEYLDVSDGNQEVQLGLQYDAMPLNGSPRSHFRARDTIYLGNSRQWHQTTFHLPMARLANAQSDGADFRLVASPPFLHIRRVSVAREPFMNRTPKVGGPDYSKSNSVSILLGGGETGGLKLRAFGDEDATRLANIDGVPCRQLRRVPGNELFMYFAIDPVFKRQRSTHLTIQVEYFDAFPAAGPVQFGIHYDASDFPGPNPRYADAAVTTHLSGSKAWRTAEFDVPKATFNNSQNRGSDFRIWAKPPDLFLRKVIVIRNTNDEPDR